MAAQRVALALHRADVDGAADDPRLAALVGGDAGGNQRGAARVDGGAAGQEAMVWVGPP